MKILVTGGAGYIGSHTVKNLLNTDYHVVILDNLIHGHDEFVPDNVDFVKGDLSDKDFVENIFKKYKPDGVIHFAAYANVGESVVNPSKYFNNNISNGLNLLDTMVRNKTGFIVFSSSCATYGNPTEVPIVEDTIKNPINPYGFSKLVFEKFLEYYDKAYGLKSASLRYFNAAGAMPDGSLGEWHEPETHVIPLMFEGLKNSNFKVFGNDYDTPDGSCIRDYIHVCDLADAHINALDFLMNNKESIQLNLGTGVGTSVFELIQIVEDVTGLKLNYKIGSRREGDPPVLVANPQKASKILDWKAKYDIRDIVVHAWNWEQKKNKP